MKHRTALFAAVFVVGCGGGTFDSSGSGGIPGGGGKPGTGGVASTMGGRPATGGNANVGGAAMNTGGVVGSGGATGTGGACNQACGQGRECCGGACVNPSNDPFNCGACGVKCTGKTYCGGGQCVEPPCTGTCSNGATCCGGGCCTQGQLCCDPQGPLDRGPTCVSPSEQGTCPVGCAPLCICASPDTPIATPGGDRAIATLRVGDLVYSVDQGHLKIVRLLRINRTPVQHHSVVRVELATGVVLNISGRHPTADGRTFAGLALGDQLDGVRIQRVSVVPYQHAATYDILPDSDSGAYFAGGVLVGSTLAQSPALVLMPTSPLSQASAAQR